MLTNANYVFGSAISVLDYVWNTIRLCVAHWNLLWIYHIEVETKWMKYNMESWADVSVFPKKSWLLIVKGFYIWMQYKHKWLIDGPSFLKHITNLNVRIPDPCWACLSDSPCTIIFQLRFQKILFHIESIIELIIVLIYDKQEMAFYAIGYIAHAADTYARYTPSMEILALLFDFQLFIYVIAY